MARPIKNNSDYFRHDADMRNDMYVRALRLRYGHEGYAVWCMMLEVLTDKDGFEFEMTPLNTELLAVDFGVSSFQLQEILDYCCTLGLLQRDGYKIYSNAHKKRMEQQLKHRLCQREQRERAASRREEGNFESGLSGTNRVLDVTNEVSDVLNGVCDAKEGKKKITEKMSPCTPLKKKTIKEKDQEIFPPTPQGGEEEEAFLELKKTEAMKEDEIKDILQRKRAGMSEKDAHQFDMLSERLDELGCKVREKFYLMSWGEWGKIGARIWMVLANIPSTIQDRPAYLMTCMRNSKTGRR